MTRSAATRVITTVFVFSKHRLDVHRSVPHKCFDQSVSISASASQLCNKYSLGGLKNGRKKRLKLNSLTTNTSEPFFKKAAPSSPAVDFLEGEKLGAEQSKWEQTGTIEIEDSLLVLNPDGNASRVENINNIESNFRVIAEGIERLRQFVFEKVCNELVLDLSCSVGHVERLFTTYRNYTSIQKYLKCTK